MAMKKRALRLPLEGTAAWVTARRHLEMLTEPVGPPGPDQVLVAATCSLVSAGTEMLVYRGELDVDSPHSAMSKGSYAYPIKFGYQCVGRVLMAGEASGFNEGDRVFTRHPHQDIFVIPVEINGRAQVAKIPDHVTDTQAAFLNLTEVALTALLDAPVRVGDVVAVFGQGVVGSLITRLAHKTARHIVVVDPLEDRRAHALRSGADVAVPPESAAEAVRDLTNGKGVDIAFEVTGAPAALQTAIDVTGQEGTICVVSYFGTRQVTLRLAPEFHWRRHHIISSQVVQIGSGLQPRWDIRRRTSVSFRLLEEIDPADLVSRRFPFGDAPAAYELIDQRPRDFLGLMLDYPPPPQRPSKWMPT
jgi:2-desacetyl-2-hydroxyethyl bacteriochlorophyllide A dehydrogenase